MAESVEDRGYVLKTSLLPGLVDERDRWIRLFNRLEAAVSHHKKASAEFPQTHDEALYKARDKILKDAAPSDEQSTTSAARIAPDRERP